VNKEHVNQVDLSTMVECYSYKSSLYIMYHPIRYYKEPKLGYIHTNLTITILNRNNSELRYQFSSLRLTIILTHISLHMHCISN